MTRQVQPQTKARLWLRNHRTVIMVALCMAIMVCPAFAATIDDETKNKLTLMFSSLSTAYTFVKGICIVAAAASIASLGYAFFFITDSDAEERITKAKARLFHVVTACGVLFMLPTILTTAKSAIGTTAWNPEETASNHIITPVEVKNSASSLDAFAGMDGASSESGENGDGDSSSDGSGDGDSSGSSGQNGNTQKTEEEKKKAEEKNKNIEDMKKDPDYEKYKEYWESKTPPSDFADQDRYLTWLNKFDLNFADVMDH